MRNLPTLSDKVLTKSPMSPSPGLQFDSIISFAPSSGRLYIAHNKSCHRRIVADHPGMNADQRVISWFSRFGGKVIRDEHPHAGAEQIGSRAAFYKPELDVLRFVAFLLVFWCHAKIGGPLHVIGAFGVCLFFVLSAYLITELLLREREITGSVKTGSFYIRRALRIWPLYFLILFAAKFVSVVSATFPAVPNGALAAMALMVGNIYQTHHFLPITVASLWTISIEEQFYLVIPTIARFGGKHGLYTACGVVLLTSYAVLTVLSRNAVASDPSVWLNSFVQFQFFALGALIALVFRRRQLVAALGTRAALGSGGFICWIAAAAYGAKFAVPSAHLLAAYLLLLTGSALIFLSFLGATTRIPATLRYLGKISYGLYLFHLLVLFGLQKIPSLGPYSRAAIALPLTIAVASLSYEKFERPILRFKQRFERVQSRPA